MFSQFSCPTSRPRKLRFCFESIQSPFPISSDFDYGGRRRGVEFSLAFQLNIRFFMAPFPAFNTLMTVLIHISSSSNFSFLHTAHLFYMLQSLGTLIKIFLTNIFAFPDNINIGKKSLLKSYYSWLLYFSSGGGLHNDATMAILVNGFAFPI